MTVTVYGETWTICKQRLIEAIEEHTARGLTWVQSQSPHRVGSQFTAFAKFIERD